MSSVVIRIPPPAISTASGPGHFEQVREVMPRGSNRRGFKNSVTSQPVFLFNTAASIFVPAVLYL